VLKGSIFFWRIWQGNWAARCPSIFSGIELRQGTDSTGEVKLTKDLDVGIEGRTVLIVEDILDTGLTLKYLLKLFEERKPRHLRVAVAAGPRWSAALRT